MTYTTTLTPTLSDVHETTLEFETKTEQIVEIGKDTVKMDDAYEP